MQVYIYMGGYKTVRNSGVGQAIVHQKKMLAENAEQCDSFFKADIIQINTVFPNSFFAAVFARLLGKKVIYYGHSTMEDFKNSFKGSNKLAFLFKLWIKACYNMGDVIITPTDYSKGILEGYGISKRIYAVSNGVDTDFFAPNIQRRADFRRKHKISDNDRVVISVGHYIERKGILDYIELARKMPEVSFFWFGYTNLKLVPEKVQRAIKNAPENLIFAGFANQNDLNSAYCGCDLFEFMSYEETEGIVVLEALACGTPVIVRNIHVYDGWLDDGKNVYTADSFDDFYGKTLKILSGQMTDVTKNGRNTAVNRNIKNTAVKLSGIYRELVNEKKSTEIKEKSRSL